MTEAIVTTDDGVRLWTDASGPEDGPLLILCHGGAGYWDTLEPVANMVDDRYRVVRWDQRGSARSELATADTYNVTRFVADLDAVRAHYGAEQLVVGGHSWGAALALFYAQAHPERVTALLYLCGIGLEWRAGHSTVYREERTRRLGPELAARYAELNAREERTPEEAREYRLLNESTNYADRERAHELALRHLDERFEINLEANARVNGDWFLFDRAEQARRCAELTLPALVLLGADDPRPHAACDTLVAALPHASKVVVPGGHEPWLEFPDEMRAALRGFLGLDAG